MSERTIAPNNLNLGAVEWAVWDGVPMLTFHADGRVTANPNLKPDEVAARVIDCLKSQWKDTLDQMVAARMSAG